MDPPQPQSISNAVSLLRKIGACHPSDHVLTPLGQHLASLPVNVKIGKMLIYGAILGCLEPIVCLMMQRSHKRLFVSMKADNRSLSGHHCGSHHREVSLLYADEQEGGGQPGQSHTLIGQL